MLITVPVCGKERRGYVRNKMLLIPDAIVTIGNK